MADPVERLKGMITGYDEKRRVLLIEAAYDDFQTLVRREYKEVYIQPIDSRPISDRQRRSCYAMIREIADWSGYFPEEVKEYLKLRFWTGELQLTADTLFSLSDAPMSIVTFFQKWLARFIVANDIPTHKSMISYVDDVEDYVYACTIHKKCCICGGAADLHHIDAVGMGRDRTEIIHEGLEVISLCRGHHDEIHRIGKSEFCKKYHINGGIIADRTICRIYGLKKKGSQSETRQLI